MVLWRDRKEVEMKSIRIKFKPKTIARNELHFYIQKRVRSVIHKSNKTYKRKRDRTIPQEEE